MSNSDKRKSPPSDNFVFVKPTVNIVTRTTKGGGGGYPPTEIQHKENDSTLERQKKGMKYWLTDVVNETKKKELRDETAYFVVDFKIKGDHPWVNSVFERLNFKILTFLDEEKSKVLVASEMKNLDHTAKSRKELPHSWQNLVFDIRPITIEDQIDQEIYSDGKWKEERKNIDIYLVPNVQLEKLEYYVDLAKTFLQSTESEIKDVLIDDLSKTGMLSVKADFSTTSKLLQKSSFVYKVHYTPEIGYNSEIHTKKVETVTFLRHGKIQKRDDLPEVCVIDTGVNPIQKLVGLISDRSSEADQPNNDDDGDHGTPVAYLVAYGESPSPRARVISHKILSKTNESHLVTALANAIRQYLQRTRVFTCSINFLQSNQTTLHATRIIDRIVQASNACVLFSAGNLHPEEIQSFFENGITYPDYLKKSPVSHPSDALSVVGVGSYCKKSQQNRSFAPEDSPSPFTRCFSSNQLIFNSIKPEIVDHGGNLNIDFLCKGVGVDTYSSDGEPCEKIGTSFATPIVAGHLAELNNKYGSEIQNAETMKAIIYSSCEPTQNYPDFVGLGIPNREDMLFSSFHSAKIVFEGAMKINNPTLKKSTITNEVEVFVPAGVDQIILYLVHSDDYSIPASPELNSYIEVIPEKPARESTPFPDEGHLMSREHVKRLVWNRKKGVKGYWTFKFVPHHIGIPHFLRSKVTLRYGGVIKLITNRPRKVSLTTEVRRKLKN